MELKMNRPKSNVVPTFHYIRPIDTMQDIALGFLIIIGGLEGEIVEYEFQQDFKNLF